MLKELLFGQKGRRKQGEDEEDNDDVEDKSKNEDKFGQRGNGAAQLDKHRRRKLRDLQRSF